MFTRLLAVLTLALGYAACTLEEDLVSEAGAELRFSVDTLRFDTVFTEVGSATRSFKIYNPYDRPVEIARVAVRDEAQGRFRINVDGRSGRELTDVFLPADDSVYVFVEVTVDPDAPVSVSPFVFEGVVEIEATDVTQLVRLEAFGQNAVYLPGDRGRADFRLITCDGGEVVFGGDLPYVLYGSLVIDTCTAIFPPGARMYVHGGTVRNDQLFEGNVFTDGIIFVGADGRLVIEGTLEEPVLIASDRTEEEFTTASGQFSGVRLGAGSGPHRISHADIRNSVNGLVVDSAAQLSIDHTSLRYVSAFGLYGYQATIKASNLAIFATGSSAFVAEKGGDYTLDYTTFVNLGSRDPAVRLLNYTVYPDSVVGAAPLTARLRNSIVYSSERQSILLANVADLEGESLTETFDVAIANSVIRSEDAPERDGRLADVCTDCLLATADTLLFASRARDTFLLDSMSAARGLAAPLNVLDDLRGELRDPESPDAGAYEYVEPK